MLLAFGFEHSQKPDNILWPNYQAALLNNKDNLLLGAGCYPIPPAARLRLVS